MFKHFSKLPLILIISISLVFVAPIFAGKGDSNIQSKKEKAIEQIFLEEVSKKVLKSQVVVQVGISKRQGFLDWGQGTATVIEKIIKDEKKKEDRKIIYRFLLTPHEVHYMNYVVEHWKEAGIRIFILGKSYSEIEAKIIAWNWSVAGLVLEAEVPFEQKENFDFEVMTIAKEPAGALRQGDGSYGKYEEIFTTGFPDETFVVNSAYASVYINDESSFRFSNSTAIIPRRMRVIYEGFGGPGQSGGAVFRAIAKIDRDKKEVEIERLELLGIVIGSIPYRDGLIIAVPIDIIVEKFLKEIPQLKSLNFPTFQLPAFRTNMATSFPEKEKDQQEQQNKN